MQAQDFSRRSFISQALPGASAAALGISVLEKNLPAQAPAAAPAAVFDVRTFGAKGDGKTLDTIAFQAAIDACTLSGGTVWVPSGNFVIGTVQLKSNITLHLEPMAHVLGSSNPQDYSAGKGVPPRNGNVVFLYAVQATNISIVGTGTIDGQGKAFFKGRGDDTGPTDDPSKGYFQRPHMFIFYHCDRLLIRDVVCQESAYHCMRILESRNVHLDGVTIHNRSNFNNDGFHVVGCTYVNISNCNVRTEDDACALFGSNQYVTVTNSTFSTRWSVFRFGGGNCKDIVISNCVIYRTYGCAIKMDIAGISSIENVSFSNLILDRVTGPIWIAVNEKGRDTSDQLHENLPPAKPYARNISFSNIRGTVVSNGEQFDDVDFHHGYGPEELRSCITLNGVNDNILENISFSNIHLTYAGGGTAQEADRRDVPQKSGEYFVLGTPPAYGMYARNVHGMTLFDVRLQVESPDLRPAIVLDHVQDVTICGLLAQGNQEAESLMRFEDTEGVYLSACRVLQAVSTFLQVEGSTSGSILIDGGDLQLAKTPVAFTRGAPTNAARIRA